jgi:hypothetical protein
VVVDETIDDPGSDRTIVPVARPERRSDADPGVARSARHTEPGHVLDDHEERRII